MIQRYMTLETGHCQPGRALKCVWLPIPWLPAGLVATPSECGEEPLALMCLGQPQEAGTVPGLLCPLPPSHLWETEGVETFLLAEGMSCSGPGPATHFPKVAWREAVPGPRLQLPDGASSDPGDSWAPLGPVTTE